MIEIKSLVLIIRWFNYRIPEYKKRDPVKRNLFSINIHPFSFNIVECSYYSQLKQEVLLSVRKITELG